MVKFSDVSKILDSIEKWRKIEKLPDAVKQLESRIADLETKLSHKDPLACRECGYIPVEITTHEWKAGTAGLETVQTVRRTCPRCGVIDSRDSSLGYS